MSTSDRLCMHSTCVYGLSVVVLVVVVKGFPFAFVLLDFHESFRQDLEHLPLFVYRLPEGLDLFEQHVLVLSQLGIR